ncbi:MAG: hypothetical protein A2149_05625 [Candidatus Schekmanbacteria bacterium RBG_16_38_11]|uniref:HTH merR-type domain-containing protein n=1 Tax=Candidatus Schekmanbacteria bacterium RBG_16_38_11 TaxID=1817880 RepID=A0A1F7S058_9BACT|nr:MAG: hypothetical protein A2149_05625 [Candidatus Schekmanbacteria bacterium RBG_16_38_11]
MQIGDIAKKACTSIRTIRYYEELGLISPAERTVGGFRKYNNDDLNKILIIQRLQSLGLSLSEIKNLFTIRKMSSSGGESAKKLYEFLQERSLELDKKIERLKQMKSDIDVSKELIKKCFKCKKEISNCRKNCNLTGKYEEAPKLFKAVL